MSRCAAPPRSTPCDIELGELRNSLGFLLRIAQVRVFEQFYEAFQEAGLRPGEFSVLWVIRINPGVRQGLLAEKLRIKPAHMTKTIRRLEQRKLVLRHIPERDRRSVDLSLTPEGTRFVDEHRGSFFGSDAYLNHDLTDDEESQLVPLLQRFSNP